jgi:hypothetical protein
MLSERHDFKPVNPLIAVDFNCTGAVEIWRRGTNRVIAMCKHHDAVEPIFEERSGFLIVTFKAGLVPGMSTTHVTTHVTGQPCGVAYRIAYRNAGGQGRPAAKKDEESA